MQVKSHQCEIPPHQVHWVYSRLQGSSRVDKEIDGTTLDTLGPLVPFLDRDSLARVDRKALALRLEEMQNFCLPKEALKDISSLLTQRDLLGWNGTAYFWLPRPSQLHAIKYSNSWGTRTMVCLFQGAVNLADWGCGTFGKAGVFSLCQAD